MTRSYISRLIRWSIIHTISSISGMIYHSHEILHSNFITLIGTKLLMTAHMPRYSIGGKSINNHRQSAPFRLTDRGSSKSTDRLSVGIRNSFRRETISTLPARELSGKNDVDEAPVNLVKYECSRRGDAPRCTCIRDGYTRRTFRAGFHIRPANAYRQFIARSYILASRYCAPSKESIHLQ